MTVEDLLSRLEAVHRTSQGYMARCPAHGDTSPSLAIKEGERGLLVKCWAGCTLDEISVAQRALFMTDGQRVSGHHFGYVGGFSAPVAVADGGGRAPRSLLGVVR